MIYHVLCFELSGLLDGQIVKALKILNHVSLFLAIAWASKCVGS